jgi:hypothetical protein
VQIRQRKNDATDAISPSGSPAPGTSVKSAQVCVDHLLVAADSEQQRHVDVDAAAGELLDGGQSGLGSWELDHHVRFIEAPPVLKRVGNGRPSVIGEIRRAFE